MIKDDKDKKFEVVIDEDTGRPIPVRKYDLTLKNPWPRLLVYISSIVVAGALLNWTSREPDGNYSPRFMELLPEIRSDYNQFNASYVPVAGTLVAYPVDGNEETQLAFIDRVSRKIIFARDSSIDGLFSKDKDNQIDSAYELKLPEGVDVNDSSALLPYVCDIFAEISASRVHPTPGEAYAMLETLVDQVVELRESLRKPDGSLNPSEVVGELFKK